ncbi:MAG: double-strand break repair helicase AddA [Lactobacillaceae bacterium]|jgi:ATP-dependent helicase/nuclease subunit A|nr:double-strand break repair helicase AddA [Lactobacillaceae bacterium]
MINEDIEASRKLSGERASRQQRKASNPHNSVWVQASAGTGKTKVLSDRVLRLLLNDVKPERILCLTYTKAAAVEMSSRIAGRLSRWAVLEQDKLCKELETLLGELPTDVVELEAKARKLFAMLLDTPGGMKIQTIHSFCQEILKRFPLEAKISPYFEVMDDRTANEALIEIKDNLIKHIEYNPDSNVAKALAYLTKNVSEYSFPKIMNSITDNRNKISKLFDKYDDIEGLVSDVAASLGIGRKDTKETLITEFFASQNEILARDIMNAWFNGSDVNKKLGEILSSILSSKDKKSHYSEYKNLFLDGKNNIRKKFGNKDAVIFFPDLEIAFYEEAERVLELESRLNSLDVLASTKAVLMLADDLIRGYNDYKNKRSKMDYEDLIVLTKDLLENKSVADWVLFKLDGGIDHILIDEAQDTSPSQWQIVKALTGEFFSGKGAKDVVRTVFAVGDRKQSIYSFQGADPKEFEKSREHFASITNKFENIRLEISFRSTSTVLDLVNHVFADDMAKKGVVLEGEDITHIPFRMGDGGSIELWPIVEADNQENGGYEAPIRRKSIESSSTKLAREIARNIKNTVEKKEILVSQNRPVQYKDFLVLVQRRNSFVEELIRECKNIDVNIAGIDKIKLLEQIAIQDLIAIGQFLLLPADDLILATILKSPIFGLDDDDLFKLCYNRGGQSLFQRLAGHDDYAEAASQLKELLNKTDFLRPFELYSYILNSLNGRKKFIERMGFDVIDGIEEFVNLTLKYEQEHIPNLQGFIDWITKDEVEIKREQEQSEIDAVRIMTVHGSKGLQAPIVILPDTVRVVSAKKESGILWDDLFYYPLSSSKYDKKCSEIKTKENELSLEEYRRLLYVALTRAEDRLCICGYDNRGNASDSSWYNILSRKISEIGTKKENGKIIYQTEQKFEALKKQEKEFMSLSLPRFEWISKPAEAESPLSKPFRPSVDEDADNTVLISPLGNRGENRYRRGLIIHKLLQFLPSADFSDRRDIIDEFINKNAPDIYGKEQITEEILRLFKDDRFTVLFGPNSREEVPIMGEVDGKIISAQIDRLVVLEDKIMVVDFKTNRPAAKDVADVPAAYLKQLALYEKLLAKIYPDKNIESYILWTDIAELMKIA